MTKNIIVTTGIYDVIKDHIRRKKVTQAEEDRLAEELKNAVQVRRKELPEETVTVNRKVTILDHSTNQEKEYFLYLPPELNLKRISTQFFLIWH